MALITEVKQACRRLAPLGWNTLLRGHDLDISKADLAAELSRDLRIDSNVPGFGDFTTAGKRGIEPGLPAASLLYHVLAALMSGMAAAHAAAAVVRGASEAAATADYDGWVRERFARDTTTLRRADVLAGDKPQ